MGKHRSLPPQLLFELPMPKIILYSKAHCPYCEGAKQLLQEKGVAFQEIDVTDDEKKLAELVKRTNHQTIPQIFIGGKFIGGFQELQALDESGELDRLLK